MRHEIKVADADPGEEVEVVQLNVEVGAAVKEGEALVEIASDKRLTNQILSDLGLPVPRQARVRGPNDAIEAAETIGYPVVVKPLDGNHGRGVSINLRDAEQVRAGFEEAYERASTVIVETYQEGHDDFSLVLADAFEARSGARSPRRLLSGGSGRALRWTCGETVFAPSF